MEGLQAFKALLSKRLSPWFRDRSFTPKGHRFVKWEGRNCQVIGFRRSKWSVSGGYEFQVDLGILSQRIWNFYVRVNESGRVKPPWTYPVTATIPRFPYPEDCHWRTSVQDPILVPAYFNKPWSIRDESEVSRLADEIESVLASHAIPALDKYATDEALRDLWLQSPKFAGTRGLRLIYLAVLLCEIGPRSELPPVLGELRTLALEKPTMGEAVVAELERTLKTGE